MKRLILASIFVLVVFVWLTGCQIQNPNPALDKNNGDILVGINYFAGWWPGKASKWLTQWNHPNPGQDWRGDYPDRLPLLGMYNSQESMDKDIVAASDYGVDFFAILWYHCDENVEGRWPNSHLINKGLEYFINSPEAHRMKFFIELCNHPPYNVFQDGQWAKCVEIWIEAMKQPGYLRIDNRLVFKIHGAGGFLMDCDMDADCTKSRLNFLRQKARDAGLGEMVIAGGNTGLVRQDHWAGDVFDFAGDYMQITELKGKDADYPYNTLADYINQQRLEHTKDTIPYMPYMAAGFNDRPWGAGRPSFALPTRQQWLRELKRIADDLNSLPNLGIPKRDGLLQKIFTIYAWNEFGEGGFVAPTRGDGYMKLECIKEVFHEE